MIPINLSPLLMSIRFKKVCKIKNVNNYGFCNSYYVIVLLWDNLAWYVLDQQFTWCLISLSSTLQCIHGCTRTSIPWSLLYRRKLINYDLQSSSEVVRSVFFSTLTCGSFFCDEIMIYWKVWVMLNLKNYICVFRFDGVMTRRSTSLTLIAIIGH